MLYLVGLGLDEKSYSKKAFNIISKADKIYIENYTIEFPYNIKKLESKFKDKKFIPADRKLIEQNTERIVKEAENKNVVILIYGSPLTATTHITLMQEARRNNVKSRVIHNASVLDAVAETGLQIYKFGKIASMPSFEANSYIDIIKDNLSIKAHTLILIDIGMGFDSALKKLIDDAKKKKVDLDKIVVCSRLGTKEGRIYYKNIKELKKIYEIKPPFCLIVPGEMHFVEKEVLESFNN